MLSDHGEDWLVRALLAQLPPASGRAEVCVPAGEDDCAVVKPVQGKRWQLLKTDCLIEGVHFLSETAPEKVGWKALCRPLSDIAATGGKPVHALVTFAINPRRSLDWATGVYKGIGQAAAEYGVGVVGGETASSPGASFLSVCLTGSVRPERCVSRGGGRPGDRLYVTGRLGGSFHSGHHLRFRPRLEEGRWLARHFAIHAMMDLSDGLAADLPRLARASGTGFRVDHETLPLNQGCSVTQALGDGEDYELLFALSQADGRRLESAWERRFPSLKLSAVGNLEQVGVYSGLQDMSGFDHFTGLTR